MFGDEAREATEAAIERTAREPVPWLQLDDRVPDAQPAVEWEAGGVRFCCFVREDRPDLLHVYGDDEVGAFELEADELRASLEETGALEADVDVLADELEWFPTAEPFRPEDVPSRSELERLRGDAPFEYRGEYERPGVRAVVSDLRERYRIGTAVAGEFGLGDDEVLRELWSEDGLEYEYEDFSLGVAFLRSEAVQTFLETATPEQYGDDVAFRESWRERGGGFTPSEHSQLQVSFRRVRPTRLDGLVAEVLLGGGAYNGFEGDTEEAKALGRAFARAFTDGPPHGDQTIHVGRGQWSEWFVYTDVWDVTILLEDHDEDLLRLFAATCTD